METKSLQEYSQKLRQRSEKLRHELSLAINKSKEIKEKLKKK